MMITLLFSALLAVAAQAAPAAPPPATRPAFVIVDGDTLEPVSLGAFLQRCAAAEAVIVGERHGDPLSHHIELLLLVALTGRREMVVLTMEQFERDTQPALDGYLAGTLTEPDFLAASRPWNTYARDYRPLIEFARRRALPVRAANLPRPLASRIAQHGSGHLPEPFSPEERTWIAAGVRTVYDDYWTRFQKAMTGHPGTDGAPDEEAVRRMYQAQCAKDETMAESIAMEVRRLAGAGVVLHTNGQFHSDWFFGVPRGVRYRLPGTDLVTISVLPVLDPEQDRGRATFLVVAAAAAPATPAVPRPQQGAMPRPQRGGPLSPPKQ